MNGVAARLASLPQSTQASVSRAIQQAVPIMNGIVSNGSPAASNTSLANRIAGVAAVPQAQMQSYMQGQQRLSQNGQDHARVISEASRLSEQQRFMQQRQYQSQIGGPNGTSPSALASNMSIPVQPNAAILAGLQSGVSGKISPAATNGTGQASSSSSPSLANAVQAQQLSSGMVPLLNQITSQLKAMHPQASNEQIKAMATANLHQHLHLRSQNQQASNNIAMNGNVQLSPQQQTALAYSANALNPQLYSQFLRSQQFSQSRNSGNVGDTGGPRPDSRGASSQNKNDSLPSASSQSPRPPQAQMASTGSS